MKNLKGLVIIVGISAIAVIPLFKFFYDTTSPVTAQPAAVKVEINKIDHTNWNFNVSKIQFQLNPSASNVKLASIVLTVQNTQGVDKAFLPTGNVVSVVGTSGKVYDLKSGVALDNAYKRSESARKESAKEQGRAFEPGIFKVAVDVVIDASEENITKLIYLDESGTKMEIPVQKISPEVINVNGY